MKFRTLVAESLEKDDAKRFKEIIEAKLMSSYHTRQKALVKKIHEESDPETAMVTAVQNASKSFGGSDFVYNQGVLTLSVPCAKASIDFAKYLDSNDSVESYEVTTVASDDNNGSPVDLEVDRVAEDAVCDFTIYFATDNVRFESVEITEKVKEDDMSDEEDSSEDDSEDMSDEEDDEEEVEEGCKGKKKPMVKETFEPIEFTDGLLEVNKVVAFLGGLKQIKMACPPGQKWDPTAKKCVKMSAGENRTRHIASLKAARKAQSKQGMIAVKRAKSMKKRIAAGY
jgi:hypothetical protein